MEARHSRSLTTVAVLVFLAGVFVFSWTIKLWSSLKEIEQRGTRKDMIYLGTQGVVFQDRDNTCGPATLKMILSHHGVNITLRELEKKVRMSARGSSLSALKEAAESFGLNANGLMLKKEDLRVSPLPLVLFVRGEHFIVLDSVDVEGSLFVRDPMVGRMKITLQGLEDIWKGEALVFDDRVGPQGHDKFR